MQGFPILWASPVHHEHGSAAAMQGLRAAENGRFYVVKVGSRVSLSWR
jgi:hypothetical protein